MTTHDQTQNVEEQSSATREADRVKETVRERATTVADTAQQKLDEVTTEAEEQARRVAHAAEDEARNMATERKSQVAAQLDSVANAFRSSSRELRSQQQGASVAPYVERVAEEVGHLSSYLSNHSVDEMLMDAENLARRQPELFIGGAFALGVLAGRFFKSSARAQQPSNGGDNRYGLQRGTRPLPAPDATEQQREFPRERTGQW